MVYLYKLVQLHSTVLETIFDFCKSKTRTIKNFDNRIFENRLTTLIEYQYRSLSSIKVSSIDVIAGIVLTPIMTGFLWGIFKEKGLGLLEAYRIAERKKETTEYV